MLFKIHLIFVKWAFLKHVDKGEEKPAEEENRHLREVSIRGESVFHEII